MSNDILVNTIKVREIRGDYSADVHVQANIWLNIEFNEDTAVVSFNMVLYEVSITLYFNIFNKF